MSIILIISLVIIIIVWLSQKKNLLKQVNDLKSKLKFSAIEKDNLIKKLNEFEKKNAELCKYEGLVEIEKKAALIISEAEINSNKLLDEAKQILNNAQIESKDEKLKSERLAEQIKQGAESLLSNATIEAKNLIDEANSKATEIAGEAMYALNNLKELEKAAIAMRNIIEGYGDKYLVPIFTLLDNLAEEFSHLEAGERLKTARERSRQMILNGTAARCEYVKADRRGTAINFVLDAFNGKVDSIMSLIKKDNFGILQQKIKDVYQVVNHNGSAFRNAVITEEFLNSRIDELKWAVIAMELKSQEQEEQRRIKEQIREEERARREFEKAMREAQKEEETLKKLIEKAQNEALNASDQQKFKLEAKLRELEEKLKLAESKNQRALSMAQQTKCGNVYIISNIGSFGENVYKIGMTRRLEPLDRIKELGDASVPFDFDVHSMIFSDNAPGLERELHKKFLRLQMNKVNPRKEFFKISLKEIKEEVEKMNIDAKWTMTAEARQYRESLSIEESITNDLAKQLEWEKYQMELDSMPNEIDELIEA